MPGKVQEPKREPEKATMPATDAEAASQGKDPRLEEALSHGSRQLQAMAELVNATGSVPIFVNKPGCAGSEKGSEGSDRIRRGHNRSPGSDRSAEAQAEEKSKTDAEAKAKARGASPDVRDLSSIMCHYCQEAGHHADRCPEKGAPGQNAGCTPPGSPQASDSSS